MIRINSERGSGHCQGVDGNSGRVLIMRGLAVASPVISGGCRGRAPAPKRRKNQYRN